MFRCKVHVSLKDCGISLIQVPEWPTFSVVVLLDLSVAVGQTHLMSSCEVMQGMKGDKGESDANIMCGRELQGKEKSVGDTQTETYRSIFRNTMGQRNRVKM